MVSPLSVEIRQQTEKSKILKIRKKWEEFLSKCFNVVGEIRFLKNRKTLWTIGDF